MKKEVLVFEQSKLEEAQKIILDEIIKLTERIGNNNHEIKELFEYIHDQNLDGMELLQSFNSIGHLENIVGENNKEITFYNKILKKPFFARLDINNKDTVSTYYIGLKNILKDFQPFVLDWRAPVSSLLYYSDLGKTSYMAPKGQIFVDLILKRQFSINDNKIVSYIDSGLKINDDILIEALANNTSDYMTNIVATIQKEQNEIIRKNPEQDVVINGVAGSGKTSIALHRIAYILYAMKNKVSSNNIRMISPNNLFDEYVSQLLPELGEENVCSSTFEGVLREFSLLPNQIINKNEMIEGVFGDESRQKFINIKHSLEFFDSYNEYLSNLDIKKFVNLLWKNELTDEELRKADFYKGDKTNILERIKNCVSYIINEKQPKLTDRAFEKEVNKKLSQCNKMLTPSLLLENYYKKIGIPFGESLKYEDLNIYSYTKMKINGCRQDFNIKYLYIDEMQDYDPFSLSIIKSIFGGAKLILCGDYRQNVFSSQSNLEFLKRIYPQIEVDNLNTSYRSTTQIVNFAQKIIDCHYDTTFVRNGENPFVLKCGDETSQFKFINKYVKENPNLRVAVLARTEKEATQIFEKCPEFDLVSNDSDARLIGSKKIITTIHLSKGLEYDIVLIPFVDEQHYKTQLDKQNLYVASTRALHKLVCLYSGNLSKFIPKEYIKKSTDKYSC